MESTVSSTMAFSMPLVRFVERGLAEKPSSGYAPRIPEATWTKHRSLITKLHSDHVTHDCILQFLAHDHNFRPSIGQLRDRMKKWGIKTYKASPLCSKPIEDFQASTQRLPCPVVTDTVAKHGSRTADTLDSIISNVMLRCNAGDLTELAAREIQSFGNLLLSARLYSQAFQVFKFLYIRSGTCSKWNTAGSTWTRSQALDGCHQASATHEQAGEAHAFAYSAELSKAEQCNQVFATSETSLSQSWNTDDGCGREQVLDELRRVPVRHIAFIFASMDGTVRPALRYCIDKLRSDSFQDTAERCLRDCLTDSPSHFWNVCYRLVYWRLVMTIAAAPPDFLSLEVFVQADKAYEPNLFEVLAIMTGVITNEVAADIPESWRCLSPSAVCARTAELFDPHQSHTLQLRAASLSVLKSDFDSRILTPMQDFLPSTEHETWLLRRFVGSGWQQIAKDLRSKPIAESDAQSQEIGLRQSMANTTIPRTEELTYFEPMGWYETPRQAIVIEGIDPQQSSQIQTSNCHTPSIPEASLRIDTERGTHMSPLKADEDVSMQVVGPTLASSLRGSRDSSYRSLELTQIRVVNAKSALSSSSKSALGPFDPMSIDSQLSTGFSRFMIMSIDPV